jgi:hypothetical protein
MTAEYWICAGVTLTSAIVSFAFSVVAVKGHQNEAKLNALYAASRSAALVGASAVAFFYHRRDWLAAIALTMILVQALDAIIGGIERDAKKTIGPAFIASLNIALLVWLLT